LCKPLKALGSEIMVGIIENGVPIGPPTAKELIDILLRPEVGHGVLRTGIECSISWWESWDLRFQT
jgi:hypothetical protein